MTKQEKHEITKMTSYLVQNPSGLDTRYKAVRGSMKGFRQFIKESCVEFWGEADPYLDKRYLDISWLEVDGKILNVDDVWDFALNILNDEESNKNARY